MLRHVSCLQTHDTLSSTKSGSLRFDTRSIDQLGKFCRKTKIGCSTSFNRQLVLTPSLLLQISFAANHFRDVPPPQPAKLARLLGLFLRSILSLIFNLVAPAFLSLHSVLCSLCPPCTIRACTTHVCLNVLFTFMWSKKWKKEVDVSDQHRQRQLSGTQCGTQLGGRVRRLQTHERQ